MTSTPYTRLVKQGPFPERIDPWVEKGRYFQQLHASLISMILDQISDELIDRGYIGSREASLQIAEQGQPDLAVRRNAPLELQRKLDYTAVATALHVNPGVALEWDKPELDAIYIKRLDGTLVTIVEVISPSNKADRQRAAIYLQRRLDLTHRRDVNVVELDLTRSNTRLLAHPIVDVYPYHIAVLLPETNVHVLGLPLDIPLEDFALPLRDEGLVVQTHAAYAAAYRQVSAAAQIDFETKYAESELPFPSLLTVDERQTCLDAVAAWQAQLATLRPMPSS